MTRRRRALAFAVSLALLAVAAGAGFLALPRSAVTQANIDRVRGLPLAEVEQRLGAPGELWEGALVSELALQVDVNPPDVASARLWHDGRRAAVVLFNADGLALGGMYEDDRPAGLLTRLRRLLEL